MPNNLTDSNAFTSPIQAPADGDAVSAAIADLGHQGLANRTLYLHRRLFGDGTAAPTGQQLQVSLNRPAYEPANLVFSWGVGGLYWYDTGAAGGIIGEWFWDRPVTGRIVSFMCTSQGVGHGGIAPATPPTLALYRIDRMAAVPLLIATATDAEPGATYDTVHEWNVSGLAEDINYRRGYLFSLTGETGVGSQINTRYFQIRVEVQPAP
jgi:hypothetical protein